MKQSQEENKSTQTVILGKIYNFSGKICMDVDSLKLKCTDINRWETNVRELKNIQRPPQCKLKIVKITLYIKWGYTHMNKTLKNRKDSEYSNYINVKIS